jgi:hypothetical protein
MGKGSTPRPIPDRKTFESNWASTFGKKEETLPSEAKTDSLNVEDQCPDDIRLVDKLIECPWR